MTVRPARTARADRTDRAAVPPRRYRGSSAEVTGAGSGAPV